MSAWTRNTHDIVLRDAHPQAGPERAQQPTALAGDLEQVGAYPGLLGAVRNRG